MYLLNAGFTDNDIKELRFLCTEYSNEQVFYWHFVTKNKSMIKTAKTGNQQFLDLVRWADNYRDLPPLEEMSLAKYMRLNDLNTANTMDFVGNSASGGFTDTSFGSSERRAYWTVVGSNPNRQKFECGTKHDYLGGTLNDEKNPNMIKSHHTIWFRGTAPDAEYVRNRLKKIKETY